MHVYASPIPAPEFNIDTYQADEDKYLVDIQEWIKGNAQPHALNGEVVRTPFADGYAQYVVAKVGGRTSLIHLDVGDAWRDGRFENTVTVRELKDMVARQRERDALFAR